MNLVRAQLFGFLLLVTCCSAWGQHPQNEVPQTEDRQSQSASIQLVTQGIQLEQSHDWVGAIQHYESAVREFPQSSELRKRLLISRLHYDVVRRNNDSAIENLLKRVSQSQALDLYSEVVARLETSYVDSIDLKEVIRGGTAYFEVALTEPDFIDTYVPGRSRKDIERFRTSIHKLTLTQRIGNRFEARNVVAQAAQAASQQLGIQPTTTVMQFVFGAVGLLDPYSSFLSSSELNEVESQIEGNFVGLGIALQPHEVPLRILNVIPGGPAKEAGLRQGDAIVEIGPVKCEDVGSERAADMLRGPENSRVRLLVARTDSSRREFNIVRRRIEVPSVEDVEILDPATGVAYLRISSFQKTTINELDRALWDLNRQGMKSLIIDLRGNPGGWLDASIAVADRFIAKGRIVSTRGKNGIENQNYMATTPGTWNVPLTVLIDKESASASEILAGAIRDNRRGDLIGQTTYGKGSVQGLFHTRALASGVRLTVSKFYSPSGTAISERGVKPTLAVADQDRVHYVAKPNPDQPASDSDRVLAIALERASSRQLAQQPQLSRN